MQTHSNSAAITAKETKKRNEAEAANHDGVVVSPDGQNIMTITIATGYHRTGLNNNYHGGRFLLSKFDTPAAASKAFAGLNTFVCPTCGCHLFTGYLRVQHRKNTVDSEYTRDASIHVSTLATKEQKKKLKAAWMSTCLARLNSSTKNSSSFSFDSSLPNLRLDEK